MTFVSKYPLKATSDIVSVDPLLLFQQLITVRYRCAKVWGMCLSSSTIWGYWHHAVIRQTISSKCHTGISTPLKCMRYVFILQHYLRLLAPCCNPTNHLKQMPYRDEYTLKILKSPACQLHLWWRCSDPQNSMENWADLWVTVWKVYWVCQKRNMTNQSSFCLMATQVVLLQKTILIWDGRNHLVVNLLIRKRQPSYTA